jgi:hypothetical protein
MITLKISEGVNPRLSEALQRRRLPNPCAVCGWQTWTLLGGYVNLQMVRIPGKLHLVEVMPCAAMVCENCGNTHLLNLIQLGLGDLVGRG